MRAEDVMRKGDGVNVLLPLLGLERCVDVADPNCGFSFLATNGLTFPKHRVVKVTRPGVGVVFAREGEG